MREDYPETVLAISRDDLPTLQRLLLDPTRLNEVDPDGRTPLMAASIGPNLGAVQMLLAAGADLDLQDPGGWSALHFAAQEQSYDVCLALLNAGARHDLRDSYGNTPLLHATFSSRGRGEVILLLRQRGADALARNNSGVSACDLALRIANFDVARFSRTCHSSSPPPNPALKGTGPLSGSKSCSSIA